LNFDITEWMVKIPVLLFAITIHEYAHGKAALSLGDPTARDMGRLSYNPIRHIDPLGALCLFLFNFGWAKPVPVNPRYFQNPRRDTILMSLSGPLANLSAAMVAGLFARYFLLPFAPYQQALAYLVLMNTGLAVFNLLPLPPLDGAHVLENLLPPRLALSYRRVFRYGPIIILAVVLLDNFAHTGILGRILVSPILHIAHLFAGDNLFRLLRML
jgi:Zn-dependent protease